MLSGNSERSTPDPRWVRYHELVRRRICEIKQRAPGQAINNRLYESELQETLNIEKRTAENYARRSTPVHPAFHTKIIEKYWSDPGTRTEIDDAFKIARDVALGLAQEISFPAVSAKTKSISEDFVLDPTSETLPRGLRSQELILHREDIVDSLRSIFATYRSDCLVTLVGPPYAGKSAVFQKLAEVLSNRQSSDMAVALLYVDLGNSQRPLKSFDLALRQSSAQPIAPSAGTEAATDKGDEDEENEPLREFEFVRDGIAGRLRNRNLVVFLEGYSEICDDDGCVRELQRIIGSPIFRRAFNFLESRGETIPALSLSQVPVTLPAFTPPQSEDYLVKKGQPADRATAAIELLDSDILYPGLLRRGAIRYDPQLTRLSGETPTGLDLALAIDEQAATIAYNVVAKLCAEGADTDGAMISLMCMSLLSETAIPTQLLASTGLTPIPRERLLRLGWLARPEGDRITGFGRSALRSAAASTLSGRAIPGEWQADALRNGLRRLIAELSDKEWAHISPALNATVAWLRANARHETELLSEFQILLAQVTGDDSVSSFTEEQERRAAPEFLRRGENGDFDAALAALVLYARAHAAELVEDELFTNFSRSLRQVTEFAQSGVQFNARQLFALDAAIYHGARRFRLHREALEVRKAVCARLAEQEAVALGGRDGPWLAAWLGFLINAADQAVSCGDQDAMHEFAAQAERIEKETRWLREDSWSRWRLARLALLRARVTPNAVAAKAEITEAASHAAMCVSLAPHDARCVRFYVRTVRRLVEAEEDDGARKRLVDDVVEHLEDIFGPPDDWDVSVRAQAAALMRDEGRRALETEYQRGRIRQALQLLRTTRPRGAAEIENDRRALLVQARLQAFLGDADAALASCDKSLALDPRPSAWRLKFRLLDVAGGGQQDWWEVLQGPGPNFAPLSPKLREAIRAFRASVPMNQLRSAAYGALELQIIEREHRSEGSLERLVARQLWRHQQVDYLTLPKHEKLKHLSRAFRRREDQIKGIGNRFERSPAFFLAQFRNNAQYVRSVSVLTGDPSDVDAALAVLDQGLKEWENNHLLLFNRAEYLRYLWRMDEAIEEFRKLKIIATRSELRQNAAISLVRAFHTMTVHREDADPNKRAEWLGEAKQILDNLAGSGNNFEDIAILRDHISLEAGDPIDWASLRDMYDHIVGCIDGFPTSLLANFDRVQEGAGHPMNLADSLQRNFADPEVLGLAGSLYLLRAQKNIGNQRPDDFACAVGCFRAQALLERSWSGQEHPGTSFRIGRAIVLAAEAFQSVNPIEGLDRDGRADQLALAEAKFNSAQARSTGEFRETARTWQRRTAQLRAEFVRKR